jgi:hypothetical protein
MNWAASITLEFDFMSQWLVWRWLTLQPRGTWLAVPNVLRGLSIEWLGFRIALTISLYD